MLLSLVLENNSSILFLKYFNLQPTSCTILSTCCATSGRNGRENFSCIMSWQVGWEICKSTPFIHPFAFCTTQEDLTRIQFSESGSWTSSNFNDFLLILGISLLTPLPNRRFLIPVYWALQMEINRWANFEDKFDFWQSLMLICSIFLHTRTIMQLSGYNVKLPDLYRAVVYANIFRCWFKMCNFLVFTF